MLPIVQPTTCNKCRTLEHFASQCHTKNTRARKWQATESQADENRLIVIYGMRTLDRAPTVKVLVQGENGSKSLSVLSDSGVDTTAADTNVLQMLGEDLNNPLPARKVPALSVDGLALHSLGQMTVKITLSGINIEDALHIFHSFPVACYFPGKPCRPCTFF